jgi:hypothetical protein
MIFYKDQKLNFMYVPFFVVERFNNAFSSIANIYTHFIKYIFARDRERESSKKREKIMISF